MIVAWTHHWRKQVCLRFRSRFLQYACLNCKNPFFFCAIKHFIYSNKAGYQGIQGSNDANHLAVSDQWRKECCPERKCLENRVPFCRKNKSLLHALHMTYLQNSRDRTKVDIRQANKEWNEIVQVKEARIVNIRKGFNGRNYKSKRPRYTFCTH